MIESHNRIKLPFEALKVFSQFPRIILKKLPLHIDNICRHEAQMRDEQRHLFSNGLRYYVWGNCLSGEYLVNSIESFWWSN